MKDSIFVDTNVFIYAYSDTEPELRNDFIMRMKDIDLKESIMVEDFGERYGLTQCLDLP